MNLLLELFLFVRLFLKKWNNIEDNIMKKEYDLVNMKSCFNFFV